MIEREQIIKNYFQSWIDNNCLVLEKTFSSDAVYSECYGPEYYGLETIQKWFVDWHTRGSVLSWEIKQFIHQGDKTVVEWYFKCYYDGNVCEFDGVSIIEFSNDNHIIRLKEFQSKIPHYRPYD